MTHYWHSYHLGRVDYQIAWQLQKDLAQARGHDLCPNTLLLLNHPHTYTLGSSGKYENLLLNETERAERGIAVYEVDRGGDITYHGPGQLVGYPIIQLDINQHGVRIGVVDYIRQLEAVIIRALEIFGVSGERFEGFTGVWINWHGTIHKIAAIGVKVTVRGVTRHGFALNINTDMSYFKGIIPCGLDDKPVISLAQILGHNVDESEVIAAVENAFVELFDVEIIHQDMANLLAE